ncbi:MAG: arginase family protein [Candidatus Pacearchaeota archaeon]|nr:arginase family protein [Candidatus Pacearchaeota archaeon]
MLIVKVPFINGLGKTKGCEKTPELLPKISVKRAIDIKADNSNIKESLNSIYSEGLRLLEREESLLFVGGDHALSFPLVRAFHAKNKDGGLIVLDAHADCMAPMPEPTHEEWLRALIEQGFNPKNIILVGLRKVEPEEAEFLKSKGINCFWIEELSHDFEESVNLLMEETRKFPAVYLSIDIDVVDPAFAPATGYPEPGGLSSREAIYLIQRLKLLKSLKAADLVEINPEKDLNGLTLKLASRILDEFS